MNRIYLDHNATAPVLPEVAEVLAQCYAAGYGNPASQHHAGREARRLMQDARDSIAAILGARLDGPRPDRLIFTSGGTEANNLAILGVAEASSPGTLITSSIEHASVSASAQLLAGRGWHVRQVPVSVDGIVDVARFSDLVHESTDGTLLVSIMLANNETGVIQPIAECAQIARDAYFHCDAAQAVGKVPVNFRELAVQALSIAAHKLHGPKGIGALLLAADVTLSPAILGGHQQQGFRAGTEPIELVLGMQRALELWQQDHDRMQRLATLRDRFEALLRDGWPNLVINGGSGPRLPHVANVSFPGLDRQALVMALDLAGIACSTGSACASGSSEPSPVLLAMGCPMDVVQSSLRFSLGAPTTAREVDEATSRILKVCTNLRSGFTAGKSGFVARNSAAKSL